MQRVTAMLGRDGDPQPKPIRGVDLDTAMSLLSVERRRVTIDLVATDGPLTQGELAETIAAMELEKPAAALSAKERKRVYICMTQSHLGKLDDADAIAWDDRHSIRPARNTQAFQSLIQHVRHAVGAEVE